MSLLSLGDPGSAASWLPLLTSTSPLKLERESRERMEEVRPSTICAATGAAANGGTPSTPDPDTIKMFVGQIPRAWNEIQCRELFEEYGPVYQLNILRDKQSQASKGCCFVTYYHRKDAISAQSDLHNVKTLAGMHHPIQMKPADSENRNERKLFIGMISKKMSEEEVKTLFQQFGHIEDCSVLRDGDGRSKGCAFVTFASRANAQTAIKHMHHSQTMEGCNSQLVVKFADTQRDKESKKPAGAAPSTSPVATNQMLQPGVNGLLAVLQSALLQQTPQLNQQQNMLSLLGNVLTGLGRLSDAQQSSVPSSSAPTGVPAGSSLSPPLDSAAAFSPLLQQQAALQQQRLLELAYLQQQQQQQQQTAHSNMHEQLLQQQAALLQQSLLQQNSAASPLLSSSKEAALLQQQQLVQHLSSVPTSASAFDNFLQPSSISLAGLMPTVSLATATATQSTAAASGNGQSKGPDGCNLFIYHLPQDFTDSDLYNTFVPFGNVLSAKVFIDKQTNLSKCFGFVSYDNAQSAANAISGMNGFQIGSKRLKVQLKNSRGGGSHPYAPPGGLPSAISI